METLNPSAKAPCSHDGNSSKLSASGCCLEESSQPKNGPSKIPQDTSCETEMETIKSPGCKISELLKEKEQEWMNVVRKNGPLRLLDLPLELLTEIVTEVTHTNDLASLALTCSALHAVVTPLIYSRFDIVWPDALSATESRSGVDALTYGLATLVMREDLFENAMLPREDPKNTACHNYSCTRCGMINHIPKIAPPSKRRRLRRGNYFSQFTKKFSLGNGPTDWVQEYLVTKESGKMLGTLVALSIARMPNLESFMWDMPTGILRDIWTALSSLGDYDPPMLSKVWIRFHDNKAALQDAVPGYPAPVKHDNVLLPHSVIPLASMPSYKKLEYTGHPTEHPNFSSLPALQSLTVLAIDELSYLEEISVLIGRSHEKLRELRIGLASKINTSGYDDYHPSVQLFAAGTEMALLLNAIHDSFDPRSENYIYKPKSIDRKSTSSQTTDNLEATQVADSNEVPTLLQSVNLDHAPIEGNGDGKIVTDSTFGLSESMSRISFTPEVPFSCATIDPALSNIPHATMHKTPKSPQVSGADASSVPQPYESNSRSQGHSEGAPALFSEDSQISKLSDGIPRRRVTDAKNKNSKLMLEVLELEGCLLNVFVLTQSIDFSILTSLTLLGCEAADILWAQLSVQYPNPAQKQKSMLVPTATHPNSSSGNPKTLRRKTTMDVLLKEPTYQLKLKRIHTDIVSSSLITFLTKTLAPNSLEGLFLQDNPTFMSPVTIDAIYKGPLRRHRASMTKVMIDSSTGASGTRPRGSSALKWMLTRDILTFVTSGRMSKIRELSMVVEYKDWHFFLQHLPSIPNLRSLYVPHIANHVYGSNLNIKELALGVVDVVTLRPEVELCYLGISTKCFEILERKQTAKRKGSSTTQSAESDGTDEDIEENGYQQSEEDEEEDGGVPTPEAGSSPAPVPNGTDADDNIDDDDNNIASSEEEGGELPTEKRIKYKLREILFYDDKISIFKARHGRL